MNSVTVQEIEAKIFLVRGKRVMLDSDLSSLYQVETKQLVRQVKRNISRFPEDFCFQLSKEEWDVILNKEFDSVGARQGGRRYAPYAFCEPGIAMLSSVLSSDRAIQVNIQIMRTFIQIRKLILEEGDLRGRIKSLESMVKLKFKSMDEQFKVVFQALNHVLYPPEKPKKIGFIMDDEGEKCGTDYSS